MDGWCSGVCSIENLFDDAGFTFCKASFGIDIFYEVYVCMTAEE